MTDRCTETWAEKQAPPPPPNPVISKMLWPRQVLNTQSYLLTGADGRWHSALCAASLHLDRLWAFKHGRRLEVTARQKGTELTLSERVLVKDFPFLKKNLESVKSGYLGLLERPIDCHICSNCKAGTLICWIKQTVIVRREMHFNILHRILHSLQLDPS